MKYIDKKNVDSVAIGVFDAIHNGHKELFKHLKKHGALIIIEKNTTTLTPFSQREKYSNLPCFYYYLNDIKHLNAEQFVQLLKNDFPKLKKIVIGSDFRFGLNRSSNIIDLKRYFDGEVVEVPEYKIKHIGVHSSNIREFLLNANITKANEFLGREYSIVGKVVKGNGFGKTILFPTINIEVEKYLIPKDGVYVSRILLKNRLYDSVTFIGKRLSIDNTFSIEINILDADEIDVCTNDCVEIFFVEYIRENRKFYDLKELKIAIKEDIEKAKKILKILTCKVKNER